MPANEYTDATINIYDHQHFIELTRAFDRQNMVRTYVGKWPIYDIFKKFPMKWAHHFFDRQEYFVDNNIRKNIERAFTGMQRTQFTNKDYRGNGGALEIHFFNSMLIYKRDIESGVGIYGPMSVHRFKNGTCQIHPGSHRLNLMCNYHKPVFFVVTDYSYTLHLEPEHKKLLDRLKNPRLMEFDWWDGRWAYRYLRYNKTMSESEDPEGKFKDIIDTFSDSDVHSFHDPERARRTYTLNEDKVLVDDSVICVLENNLWRLAF